MQITGIALKQSDGSIKLPTGIAGLVRQRPQARSGSLDRMHRIVDTPLLLGAIRIVLRTVSCLCRAGIDASLPNYF